LRESCDGKQETWRDRIAAWEILLRKDRFLPPAKKSKRSVIRINSPRERKEHASRNNNKTIHHMIFQNAHACMLFYQPGNPGHLLLQYSKVYIKPQQYICISQQQQREISSFSRLSWRNLLQPFPRRPKPLEGTRSRLTAAPPLLARKRHDEASAMSQR
jgi:hypothetical protein